jgi:large subunit ribosomal protein L1
MAKGKKYDDALGRFDPITLYAPLDALELVKALAYARFDETVEAAYNLGIDARQADQAMRGTVALPKGTGREVRILVFATGDKAREAEAAGADIVGGEDLAARISGGGSLDFDLAIATPDLMSEVGKLGRILGPRGLMPNPKAGTVTVDVAKAVEEFKAGRVEYRNDRYGRQGPPHPQAHRLLDDGPRRQDRPQHARGARRPGPVEPKKPGGAATRVLAGASLPWRPLRPSATSLHARCVRRGRARAARTTARWGRRGRPPTVGEPEIERALVEAAVGSGSGRRARKSSRCPARRRPG